MLSDRLEVRNNCGLQAKAGAGNRVSRKLVWRKGHGCRSSKWPEKEWTSGLAEGGAEKLGEV